MLHKLPRDILLKLISYIEHDYKEKYLEATKSSKSFDMITKLLHCHLEKRKCFNDFCNDFCYIHRLTMCGCDQNDSDYIINSQNMECGELININLRDDGELYDIESDELYDHHGIACPLCELWYCPNHWKEGILTVSKRQHFQTYSKTYFCKHCDFNLVYTV